MRLRRSLRTSTGGYVCALCAAVTLGFGVACGGGGGAQPTAAPAAATQASAAAVASPQRPPLASVVASPSPATASSSAATPAPSSESGGSSSTSAGGGGETYTVQSGDTLLSIAQQFYGDPTEWRRIYDANKDTIGADPDKLKLDQKLTIPPKQ
jgi:nucleoid-associated protein YgaU